jgi:hypothetical protein
MKSDKNGKVKSPKKRLFRSRFFGDWLYFPKDFLKQIRKKHREDEDGKTCGEDNNGGSGYALPFLEEDAPYVGEGDVQGHQNGPTEEQHDRIVRQEALAHGQSEELRVPEYAGKRAEQDVVDPDLAFTIIAECFVLAILGQTVDRIGQEAAQGDHEGSRECDK